MIFDIIFYIIALIIIAFWGYKGYKSGLIPVLITVLIGISTIIFSYLLNFLFARPLGELLFYVFGGYKIIALVVSIILIFLSLALLLNLTGSLAIKSFRFKFGEPTLPLRIAGSTVGTLLGIVSASLILYAYGIIVSEDYDKEKLFGTYIGENIMRAFVWGGLYYTIGGDEIGEKVNISKIVDLIVKKKHQREMAKLMNLSAVHNLINDQSFSEDVGSMDPKRIEQNLAFQNFLKDKELIEQLATMGLTLDEEGVQIINERLPILIGKAVEILDNPEFHPLMEELEADGLLQQDQVGVLILDPRFLKIVDKLLMSDVPSP